MPANRLVTTSERSSALRRARLKVWPLVTVEIAVAGISFGFCSVARNRSPSRKRSKTLKGDPSIRPIYHQHEDHIGDRRGLTLPRSTQPEPELQLLLTRLKFTLPARMTRMKWRAQRCNEPVWRPRPALLAETQSRAPTVDTARIASTFSQ
jgi:hypothetical protein